MKKMMFGVLFFLLGLAWAPAAHADEKADYQAALANYQAGQYSKAVIGFQNILLNDPNSWKARAWEAPSSVRATRLGRSKPTNEACN